MDLTFHPFKINVFVLALCMSTSSVLQNNSYSFVQLRMCVIPRFPHPPIQLFSKDSDNNAFSIFLRYQTCNKKPFVFSVLEQVFVLQESNLEFLTKIDLAYCWKAKLEAQSHSENCYYIKNSDCTHSKSFNIRSPVILTWHCLFICSFKRDGNSQCCFLYYDLHMYIMMILQVFQTGQGLI